MPSLTAYGSLLNPAARRQSLARSLRGRCPWRDRAGATVSIPLHEQGPPASTPGRSLEGIPCELRPPARMRRPTGPLLEDPGAPTRSRHAEPRHSPSPHRPGRERAQPLPGGRMPPTARWRLGMPVASRRRARLQPTKQPPKEPPTKRRPRRSTPAEAQGPLQV